MGTLHKIQHRELTYQTISLGIPFVFRSQKLKTDLNWFFHKGEKYLDKDFMNKNPYTFEMRHCHKHLKGHYSYKQFEAQISYFKKFFPNNLISHIMFASFTEQAKNYGRHKDQMDVILHQSLGEIFVEFPEYKAVCKLENNDYYLWIPRSTTHHVTSKLNRLTNSFGVEGEDPIILYR